jgi:hypothetical protein
MVEVFTEIDFNITFNFIFFTILKNELINK